MHWCVFMFSQVSDRQKGPWSAVKHRDNSCLSVSVFAKSMHHILNHRSSSPWQNIFNVWTLGELMFASTFRMHFIIPKSNQLTLSSSFWLIRFYLWRFESAVSFLWNVERSDSQMKATWPVALFLDVISLSHPHQELKSSVNCLCGKLNFTNMWISCLRV
jgi:hypothetical protein